MKKVWFNSDKAVPNAYNVRVTQTAKDRFTVAYGLQVREGLSYADAAREFGECMFHAFACDGRLSND